ncbi:MAG: hypothetical protein OIF50_08340 [Flavobacteriaceae bacterium]|nr:hypothetical protein [Flavobacteriaceae bacterium]
MYKKVLLAFCLGIGIIVWSGCKAPYSKKGFRSNLLYLQSDQLYRLQGIYSIHPIRRYPSGLRSANDTIQDSLRFNNGFDFLTGERYMTEKLKKIDPSQHKSFTIVLQPKNDTLIQLQLKHKDTLLQENNLIGRFKNGMFYLT